MCHACQINKKQIKTGGYLNLLSTSARKLSTLPHAHTRVELPSEYHPYDLNTMTAQRPTSRTSEEIRQSKKEKKKRKIIAKKKRVMAEKRRRKAKPKQPRQDNSVAEVATK